MDTASAENSFVRARFANWEILSAAADSPRQATQKILSRDGTVVSFALTFLRGEDQRMIGIASTQATSSTPPIALRIDGGGSYRLKFGQCSPAGCHAFVPLGDKLRAELLAGKTALFTIEFSPGQPVEFPITLEGLSDALDAVERHADSS
jgi:invasion protein IalB